MIHADAVLRFSVIKPANVIIQVADFDPAVYQPAVTALRNVIGQHQLDEVLK